MEEGLHPFKVAKVSTDLTDLTYIEVKGMAHKWGGSLDDSRVADQKGPRAIEMILKEFNR